MNFSTLSPGKAPDTWNGLGLFLLRLWVGQEFLLAGYVKLAAGFHAPAWFAGLDFPFPLTLLPANLNWDFAGLGEVACSLALLVGLWSRLASLGLLFITYVAVYTVHFDLGWAGWNQIETPAGLGFKVPLMLAIMLLTLIAQGAGKFSLDALRHPLRARPGAPGVP